MTIQDDELQLMKLEKNRRELERLIPQFESEIDSMKEELRQTRKFISILELQIERNRKCQL